MSRTLAFLQHFPEKIFGKLQVDGYFAIEFSTNLFNQSRNRITFSGWCCGVLPDDVGNLFRQ